MLSYCTNIHPGESWTDIRRNVQEHVLAVKEQVSPADPFPVGLRVSALAAFEASEVEARRLGEWLHGHGCFVSSLNGFPYGGFHGTVVKEQVYRPDWRSEARHLYSRRLADLLAIWLPPGMRGSISTVPVAFDRGFGGSGEDWRLVHRHLLATLEHLALLYEQRGIEIALAIEPEPGCVLETTGEVVAFFDRMALSERLRRHLGVCYDCCHQAVEFEDPAASLAQLEHAGIRIEKVQVSSSPRAVGDQIREVGRFAEPTYLHQVVARNRAGELLRFDDLPDFLARPPEGIEECRIHFHVPIFVEDLGGCGTTRRFLEDLLPRLDPDMLLEVETYSWAVLPKEIRGETVVDSIVRELLWAREAARPCTEPQSSMLSA
ncbi:MAG: metabolite traffic protein EboE [Holophagales bacterium]|nr:metabolite traffic protein EboE [Holophagales bacterium]